MQIKRFDNYKLTIDTSLPSVISISSIEFIKQRSKYFIQTFLMNQTKIRMNRRSRKKKSIQNLSTKQSLPQDEEQIATQNLFNASNYHDIVKQQDEFNNTFNMFRSVDFSQQNPESPKETSKLSRTQRIETDKKYHSHSVDLEKKKRNDLSDTQATNRFYDTLPEEVSARSASLRIRRQKIYQKIFTKPKRFSMFNSLKSNAVFVGKKQKGGLIQFSHSNFLPNNISLYKNIEQQFTTTYNVKKDYGQLAFQNSHPKTSSFNMNEKIQTYIKKFSPHRDNTFCQQPVKTQRLERIKKLTPMQKDTLNNCSEFRIRKILYQQQKQAQNLKIMNNRIFQVDPTDYSFQNRHVACRRLNK